MQLSSPFVSDFFLQDLTVQDAMMKYFQEQSMDLRIG